MKTYNDLLKEEAKTWLIDDPVQRNEKAQREFIRYPLIKKQMGLNYLDTSRMTVFDIGGGPLGGISSILNCKERITFDPLSEEYEKYFDTTFHVNMKGEELKQDLNKADLVIVTNALDHFERPKEFLQDLAKYMKSGAYFAHFHALNNALTSPHPAHQYNLNPSIFKLYLTADFEVCWYMDWQNDGLTYGWLKQPAFCGLYRKVTGYK